MWFFLNGLGLPSAASASSSSMACLAKVWANCNVPSSMAVDVHTNYVTTLLLYRIRTARSGRKNTPICIFFSEKIHQFAFSSPKKYTNWYFLLRKKNNLHFLLRKNTPLCIFYSEKIHQYRFTTPKKYTNLDFLPRLNTPTLISWPEK